MVSSEREQRLQVAAEINRRLRSPVPEEQTEAAEIRLKAIKSAGAKLPETERLRNLRSKLEELDGVGSETAWEIAGALAMWTYVNRVGLEDKPDSLETSKDISPKLPSLS